MTTYRPSGWKSAAACATALLAGWALAVLASGCGGNRDKGTGSSGVEATQARYFAVEGMTCEGCVNGVTTALKKLPGVTDVKVSLEEKKATVVADAKEVSDAAIEAAIEKAGFKGKPLAGPEA